MSGPQRGRPPLPAEQVRSAMLRVMVKPSEKARLVELVGDKSLSETVRQLILARLERERR